MDANDNKFSSGNRPRPCVAIILVNWNGWRLTVECLESIFRSEYENFWAIVCDNGSTDNSLEHIRAWARGEFQFKIPASSPVRGYGTQPLLKPLRHVIYHHPEAERFGPGFPAERLVLIETGTNLGFAGGNNVGLRYILSRNVFDYVWLLNNDTVVKSDALANLVRRMSQNRKIGICGSTIYYYDQPQEIQTLGGCSYNPLFATSKYIKPRKGTRKIEEQWVEQRLDMILGASMLVSTQLLRQVGLMNEEYFLFAEEIEWATRAKPAFRLGYAADSIIYHKRGQSLENYASLPERNIIVDYYSIRSRLLFTKRFFPSALFTFWLSLLWMVFNRVRRKQLKNAHMILHMMRDMVINPSKLSLPFPPEWYLNRRHQEHFRILF